MALPSPNLDDRRFQQLVDEAKRYVQQRSPEWTDHNVSDPGVTLIETFAYMVDQLLYRLNRVPDKNYSAFLDLLGVTLFPPTVARAEVDFWLSAPQPETVRLPAGTEVATSRGETEEAVVFSTSEELPIVPRLADPAGHRAGVGRSDRPHRAARRGQGHPVLPAPAGTRRRPAVRTAHRRAPVHRRRTPGQPGGGRRRRPAAAAAGLGGVGRCPLGHLPDRHRQHRRAEQAR